jgi:DnaJ-class molecular chaperone
VPYTHYDYLDLAPGASQARIEAAYQMLRQRTQEWTPAMLRMIDDAYRILSDSPRRHAYDRELQRIADEADAELKSTLDAHANQLPRRVQDVPAPLLAVMTAWAA